MAQQLLCCPHVSFFLDLTYAGPIGANKSVRREFSHFSGFFLIFYSRAFFVARGLDWGKMKKDVVTTTLTDLIVLLLEFHVGLMFL